MLQAEPEAHGLALRCCKRPYQTVVSFTFCVWMSGKPKTTGWPHAQVQGASQLCSLYSAVHNPSLTHPAIIQLNIIHFAGTHEPLTRHGRCESIQPAREVWEGFGEHDLHWVATHGGGGDGGVGAR